MIEFELGRLIFLLFIGFWAPGIIVSFSLVKERFNKAEKILLGVAIGMVAPVILPFFLQLIAGVDFSYSIAIITVVLWWLFSLGIFYLKNKKEITEIYEKIKKKEFGKELKIDYKKYMNRKTAIAIILLLVIYINYYIRVVTYSPIYQELDPYYYTYISYQILTLGHNLVDDGTAWWPEIRTGHRTMPLLGYMEALWYSLYTSGEKMGPETDNYLLADVASVYPPIAAALAIFFLYILFAAKTKREYALIGAGIAGFLAIFVQKTLAGEMEVQPYGFFALTFSLSMFAYMIKTKKIEFLILTLLAVSGLVMASSSEPVFVASIFIFYLLRGIKEIYSEKVEEEKSIRLHALFLIGVSLIFGIDTAYTSFNLFRGILSSLSLSILLGGLIFISAHYVRKKFESTEITKYGSVAVVLVIILILFTPIGSPIIVFAKASLKIAEFTLPLHRTIQEQGVAGNTFEGYLGFFGKTFKGDEKDIISKTYSWILIVPSFLTNALFNVGIGILNTIFGTELEYTPKEPSTLMATIFFVMMILAYELYRAIKYGEENLSLLLIGVLFPPAFVGLNKAKYIIYVGFFFAGALAIVLEKIEKGLKKIKVKEDHAYLAAIAVGIILFSAQYSYGSGAPALIKYSGYVRFQDDPIKASEYLKGICSEMRLRGMEDNYFCEAAEHPIEFANKGTNYQFDENLCYITAVGGDMDPSPEKQAAAVMRCRRIADYWIDSMEWIRYNTEPGARIISWWDYGHWINYFGLRNAVIRNEHASHQMIIDTAYMYLRGTEQELKEYMKEHGAKYALFDKELILSTNTAFGGKYGALNYLSCARQGRTDVSKAPGTSECENEQLWESIIVPKTGTRVKECVISSSENIKGIVGYAVVYSNITHSQTIEERYCIGPAKLANGKTIIAPYRLNERDEKGRLKLQKAKMLKASESDSMIIYHLVYDKDKIWLGENGTAVSGWEDRTTQFYNSNLYKAFILKELDGFDLVYETPDSAVKIFKIKE